MKHPTNVLGNRIVGAGIGSLPHAATNIIGQQLPGGPLTSISDTVILRTIIKLLKEKKLRCVVVGGFNCIELPDDLA